MAEAAAGSGQRRGARADALRPAVHGLVLAARERLRDGALKTNALVQNLVDSQWRCEATDHSEAARLSLKPNGDAVGLYGRTGRWGTMNDPELGEECAPHACLFVDIGSNRMNAAVSPPDDKTKLTLMATPAWGAAHGAPASRRERWSCSRV